MDENKKEKRYMDVARILYRSKTHEIVNRVVIVNINDMLFSIKLVEDWYGPLQWLTPPIRTSPENGRDDGADGSETNDTIDLEEGEIFEDFDDDNHNNNNYAMINYGVVGIGNDAALVGQNPQNEDGNVQCIPNENDEKNINALNLQLVVVNEGTQYTGFEYLKRGECGSIGSRWLLEFRL